MRSKYTNILELYKRELAEPQEAGRVLKDYRHKKDKVTKEILTAKLKEILTANVSTGVCVCLFIYL